MCRTSTWRARDRVGKKVNSASKGFEAVKRDISVTEDE